MVENNRLLLADNGESDVIKTIETLWVYSNLYLS
jgi:hypothetical protein